MKLTISENEGIRNFFNGSDDYIPTSELVYLHTHPLVKPNFLLEINAVIDKAALVISKKNIKGKVILDLERLVTDIGREAISDQNAERILRSLREIYSLCNSLIIKDI